jgi:hypothetical protein
MAPRSRKPSPEPLTRPLPPPELARIADKGAGLFAPAPDLAAWSVATFLETSSPLFSETHAELSQAHLGYLWTSEPRLRGDHQVVGEARLGISPGAISGWTAAIFRFQHQQWFGSWFEGEEEPDFVITIYAPWWAATDDTSALMGMKHELLHCRQVDAFGSPKFNQQTGQPIWGIRRHDVERFVEEVEWFGSGAPGEPLDRLIKAGSSQPRAGQAAISWACGTCLKAA